MNITPNGRITIERDKLQYQHLSDDEHEIRILKLRPGHWTDSIRCTLSTESLDDPDLVYHALSYAWGHHSTRSSILVNECNVYVTPSLEAALREVRRDDEQINLWVDKLCINQDDEVEKARQVALMGRIFRRCSNVLVWLGPDEGFESADEELGVLRRWSTSTLATGRAIASVGCCCSGRRKKAWDYEELPKHGPDQDDAEDPFAVVFHFAHDKHISELPCFSKYPITGHLRFNETPQFRSMWMRFRQLLSTSWHQRLWCVQEALLATNAWVLYGQWRIPFSTIRRALQNHRKHLFTCCSKVEKLFPTTYAFCPDALYTEPCVERSPDAVLRMYRYKACTNPRDKVYGMLALLERSRIEVDYTKPVRDVYIEAMRHIITTSKGSLACLTSQGFSSPNHALPSWVRDFSQTPSITSTQAEMRRLTAYDLYNASIFPPNLTFLEDGKTLHLQGVRISRIAALCPPLELPTEAISFTSIFRLLLNWRQAALAANHSVPLLNPNILSEDFWRVLIGDLIFRPESESPSNHNKILPFRRFDPSPASNDVADYTYWLRQLLYTAPFSALIAPRLDDRFVQAILCNLVGRSFFIAENGTLGVCYPNARIGDEVWVLKGGRVPFVLRAKEQENLYGLVGDCYVQGYMDGESEQGEHTMEDVRLV